MTDDNVAVYLDFENLAISAEEVYPSKERPLLLGPIVDYVTTKGTVCIKRAYADWSKPVFSRYQRMLIEHGFELVHLPGTTTQGKNGSDVKLAIDAMENMELFKMVTTFVIGSGDTDFIPLIQRILARGKKAVVIGFDHSVGNLLRKNCTEFKLLEELIGQPEKDSVSSDLTEDVGRSYGRDLMVRYVVNKSNDSPVPMAKLKLDLLRLDPSFSEKKMGFKSFKQFVKSLEEDVVEKIESSQDSGLDLVFFKDVELASRKDVDVKDEAKRFLTKKLRYLRESSKRTEITTLLFNAFQETDTMSMAEMREAVFSKTKGIPKISIRKFINTLFIAHAFVLNKDSAKEPLLERPVKIQETITGPKSLEQIYLNRVIDILNSRFPELDFQELRDLLVTETGTS